MAWSRRAGTEGLPQLTEEEKKLRGQSPYQGDGGGGVHAGHHKQPSLALENTRKATGLETWDLASHPVLLNHPKTSGKKEDSQTHPPRFHV